MSKAIRQQAILEIMSRQPVRSQAMFASELKRMGFEVTQATLSRDVAELGLMKSRHGYIRPDDNAPQNSSQPLETLSQFVHTVETVEHHIVIKSAPGSAKHVASIIESYCPEGLMGIIGGNDTCLAIMQTQETASNLEQILRQSIKRARSNSHQEYQAVCQ